MKTHPAILLPYLQAGRLEAGCDEAGRGCLAGPVFAAAVIWPDAVSLPGLHDSKKLNAASRERLRPLIEKQALAFAVALVSAEEIDAINILQASFLAMHRAIDRLRLKPDHLLIDGNRFKPYPEIQHTCIIKGDGRYQSIAAASILAKTYRDDYMMELHAAYPDYGWQQNKGYPTLSHRLAIQQSGFSPFHRRSFHCHNADLPDLFSSGSGQGSISMDIT